VWHPGGGAVVATVVMAMTTAIAAAVVTATRAVALTRQGDDMMMSVVGFRFVMFQHPPQLGESVKRVNEQRALTITHLWSRGCSIVVNCGRGVKLFVWIGQEESTLVS